MSDAHYSEVEKPGDTSEAIVINISILLHLSKIWNLNLDLQEQWLSVLVLLFRGLRHTVLFQVPNFQLRDSLFHRSWEAGAKSKMRL